MIYILYIIICNYKSIKNKKIFITYGDNNFKKSRERIINEAKQLNLFTDYIMETENVFNDNEFIEQLNNEKFKQVASQRRGGGYWIWKPYIIYKHLLKLDEGDILVYCDSGCKINNDSKNKYKNIFNDLISKKYDMILNNLQNNNENIWTKGDVLNYHNIYNNDKLLIGQYEGGRIFLIKNDNTMKIIEKWWDIAKNNPEFFDDSKSIIQNKKGFKEHRHDQSNISILCKLNDKCIGGDLNFINPLRIKE